MDESTPALWIDDPAQFEFVRGIAYGSFTSGGKTYLLRAKPETLVGSARNMLVAYAEFTGAKTADILRLPRKKKRKH